MPYEKEEEEEEERTPSNFGYVLISFIKSLCVQTLLTFERGNNWNKTAVVTSIMVFEKECKSHPPILPVQWKVPFFGRIISEALRVEARNSACFPVNRYAEGTRSTIKHRKASVSWCPDLIIPTEHFFLCKRVHHVCYDHPQALASALPLEMQNSARLFREKLHCY